MIGPSYRWISTTSAKAELILTSLGGLIIELAQYFNFEALNNKVRYEVLVARLKIAKELEVCHLKAYNNSQLIIGQVCDEYKAHELGIVFANGKGSLPSFHNPNVQQILRSENTKANMLSKLTTMVVFDLEKSSYFEIMERPSIEEEALIMQIDLEPSWINPII